MTCLAAAADGAWVAAGFAEGVAVLEPRMGWRRAAGGMLEHPGCHAAVALRDAQGAARLVTGGADGSVKLWDPLNSALLHTSRAAPGPVLSLAAFLPPQVEAGMGAASSEDGVGKATAKKGDGNSKSKSLFGGWW